MQVQSVYTIDNSHGNLNTTRFYFDFKTKKCLKFQYGGIGGNDNNFHTKEECELVCIHSINIS